MFGYWELEMFGLVFEIIAELDPSGSKKCCLSIRFLNIDKKIFLMLLFR
jgi:hypothetical protein